MCENNPWTRIYMKRLLEMSAEEKAETKRLLWELDEMMGLHIDLKNVHNTTRHNDRGMHE